MSIPDSEFRLPYSMTLADRALAAMRAAGCRSDMPVMVALSGGGDSVALLHLLRELQARGDVDVSGAAHLNHQLRGAAGDEDERFCRELAARAALPIVVERIDVASLAASRDRSVEAAGHDERSAFLERAADELGARVIVTGHTRDDQAETFLLRLLRGAGSRGLGGIHPRAGRFVRPLLDVSRRELREYLEAGGIAFREDESNDDVGIPRNWVRHRLIPFLRDEWAASIMDVLARNAAIAREDGAELDRHASEWSRSIVLVKGNEIALDVDRLRGLPAALGRRVVLAALSSPERPIGYEHVARVLALAHGPDGGAVDVPGHRATRKGELLVLSPAMPRIDDSGSGPDAGSQPVVYSSLDIPGQAQFGDGWTISAERSAGIADPVLGARFGTDMWVAVSGTVGTPLKVRVRQPGDALRPIGLGGRKKLQDLFVDRKVPRIDRDRVPLVVDAQNRIVWVVGHAIAEDFRVTDHNGAVVILKARKSQGS